MDVMHLKSIPSELRWRHRPLAWQGNDDDALTISAGKSTDLFNDPLGTGSIDNAPRLMFEPRDNFTLSARVQVDFRSTFDAGVLLVYAHADLWAKLCFELSPQGQPTLVSVVTHTLSDDCNSLSLDADQVYLRIARMNQAFAFHFSWDGKFWHLIRLFSLRRLGAFSVGFSAQSPTGDACRVCFSEIEFAKRLLADARSGE